MKVYTGSGLENTFVVEHLKRSTKYDARVTVMFEKFDDGAFGAAAAVCSSIGAASCR